MEMGKPILGAGKLIDAPSLDPQLARAATVLTGFLVESTHFLLLHLDEPSSMSCAAALQPALAAKYKSTFGDKLLHGIRGELESETDQIERAILTATAGNGFFTREEIRESLGDALEAAQQISNKEERRIRLEDLLQTVAGAGCAHESLEIARAQPSDAFRTSVTASILLRLVSSQPDLVAMESAALADTDPNRLTIRVKVAKALLDRGDHLKAAEVAKEAREAIGNAPESAIEIESLARVFHALGDSTTAQNLLRSSLESAMGLAELPRRLALADIALAQAELGFNEDCERTLAGFLSPPIKIAPIFAAQIASALALTRGVDEAARIIRAQASSPFRADEALAQTAACLAEKDDFDAADKVLRTIPRGTVKAGCYVKLARISERKEKFSEFSTYLSCAIEELRAISSDEARLRLTRDLFNSLGPKTLAAIASQTSLSDNHSNRLPLDSSPDKVWVDALVFGRSNEKQTLVSFSAPANVQSRGSPTEGIAAFSELALNCASHSKRTANSADIEALERVLAAHETPLWVIRSACEMFAATFGAECLVSNVSKLFDSPATPPSLSTTRKLEVGMALASARMGDLLVITLLENAPTGQPHAPSLNHELATLFGKQMRFGDAIAEALVAEAQLPPPSRVNTSLCRYCLEQSIQPTQKLLEVMHRLLPVNSTAEIAGAIDRFLGEFSLVSGTAKFDAVLTSLSNSEAEMPHSLAIRPSITPLCALIGETLAACRVQKDLDIELRVIGAVSRIFGPNVNTSGIAPFLEDARARISNTPDPAERLRRVRLLGEPVPAPEELRTTATQALAVIKEIPNRGERRAALRDLLPDISACGEPQLVVSTLHDRTPSPFRDELAFHVLAAMATSHPDCARAAVLDLVAPGPNRLSLLCRIAESYFSLGNIDRASETLRLIEKQEQSQLAFSGVGRYASLLSRTGAPLLAQECLSSAATHAANMPNAEGVYILAEVSRAQAELGFTAAAKKSHAILISRLGDTLPAALYQELGIVVALTESPEAALSFLRALPHRASAQQALASVVLTLSEGGRTQEAKVLLAQVRSTRIKADALVSMAERAADSSRAREAQGFITQAITLACQTESLETKARTIERLSQATAPIARELLGFEHSVYSAYQSSRTPTIALASLYEALGATGRAIGAFMNGGPETPSVPVVNSLNMVQPLTVAMATHSRSQLRAFLDTVVITQGQPVLQAALVQMNLTHPLSRENGRALMRLVDAVSATAHSDGFVFGTLASDLLPARSGSVLINRVARRLGLDASLKNRLLSEQKLPTDKRVLTALCGELASRSLKVESNLLHAMETLLADCSGNIAQCLLELESTPTILASPLALADCLNAISTDPRQAIAVFLQGASRARRTLSTNYSFDRFTGVVSIAAQLTAQPNRIREIAAQLHPAARLDASLQGALRENSLLTPGDTLASVSGCNAQLRSIGKRDDLVLFSHFADAVDCCFHSEAGSRVVAHGEPTNTWVGHLLADPCSYVVAIERSSKNPIDSPTNIGFLFGGAGNTGRAALLWLSGIYSEEITSPTDSRLLLSGLRDIFRPSMPDIDCIVGARNRQEHSRWKFLHKFPLEVVRHRPLSVKGDGMPVSFTYDDFGLAVNLHERVLVFRDEHS
jgi:tetratricopeptide (TPR) repeat protein